MSASTSTRPFAVARSPLLPSRPPRRAAALWSTPLPIPKCFSQPAHHAPVQPLHHHHYVVACKAACHECYDFTAALLHEAGHVLGLGHPDAVMPTINPATGESFPQGSNHYLPAGPYCGPNPWAVMVPGVPDGAVLDPHTGVRPSAMASLGVGNIYRCLQPDDLEGLTALYPPNCVGAHAPDVTPTIVCPTFEHEAEFGASSPPPSPSLPPPPPSSPPPPPSPSGGGGGGEGGDTTATIVLTLTASGSVSDYSDTSSLQQSIATAAGVDKSLVTIGVAAASVIITATIAVPASMSAAALKTSLSSSLGTAAAASAALGITVESDPTFKIVTKGDSETNSTVPIIGGVGEQRPFVIQHPLARRPYCHSTIRRVVPRHTLLILRRASCPAQHSWRRACALLLHRHRRRRLLLHEEEAARLHRRTRPSAERRGPVCTREQDLKRLKSKADRASACLPRDPSF